MISEQQLYDTRYLQHLFDEMQGTYELVSTITSFGFNWRWRKRLVSLMELRSGMAVCDLMAGTGESWLYALPHLGQQGKLVAVDFSRQMTLNAKARQTRLGMGNIMVLEEDALSNSITAESMDAVMCLYGTKTLAPDDMARFVMEIRRVLKAGGTFGLVEISVPEWHIFRSVYLFYLRHVIPLIGKLFLGNPENYRMLSRYTVHFGNCSQLAKTFIAHGFAVRQHSFFWGCATAITGTKADANYF